MPKDFNTSDASFIQTATEFWARYYGLMKELHQSQEKRLTEPLKNRNLKTTGTSHVVIFEEFWKSELASALGVPVAEVGKRTIRFRPHRTKSFDVCWPLTGDPKILISVKSMQNAYRNITNRVEEAFGDSAVLRLYRSKAVFGFFFFLLDGDVPRGVAEQGKKLGKGIPPFISLIEEGGDFFDLADVDSYRKDQSRSRGRQDSVAQTSLTLMDLAQPVVTEDPEIHYDGIAFAPTRMKRVGDGDGAENWQPDLSEVDPLLDFRTFIHKLVATASARKLL